MRTLAFTLLAIAVAAAIQLGLDEFPVGVSNALHGGMLILTLLLPMLATAELAYAMRIPHIIYVYVLAIASPFVAWILTVFIAVSVLGQPAHRWIL